MRILIVEDEQKMAALLHRGLHRHGYAADVARDAATALGLAAATAYDAILLDLGLPDTDGVELCRRLRDGGSAVPSARDEIEPPPEREPYDRDEDLDLQSPIDLSLNQPLEDPELDVPTVDRLLGLQPPPREQHRPAPDSPFAKEQTATTPRRNAIADAFTTLFAGEQGEAVPQPVRLGVPAPPIVTDDLIEEVTRRVLDRLSSEALRPIVSDVVSRVAERLVREEIERIRKQ